MHHHSINAVRIKAIFLLLAVLSGFNIYPVLAATWSNGQGSADAACKATIDNGGAYQHSRAEVKGDFAYCYVKVKEGEGDEIYNALVWRDEQPQENKESPGIAGGQTSVPAPAPVTCDDKAEAPLIYTSMVDDEPVGPGKDFSTEQKKKVRAKNKEKNNGKLISDDKNDPWYGKELVEPMQGTPQPGNYPAVPKNRAEVDHITPKVAGGTNSYSNARVISNEYNNKINAKGHKPKKKKC